jgi:hypothetical protein
MLFKNEDGAEERANSSSSAPLYSVLKKQRRWRRPLYPFEAGWSARALAADVSTRKVFERKHPGPSSTLSSLRPSTHRLSTHQ